MADSRHFSKLSSSMRCQLRDKEIQFLSTLAKAKVLSCNKSESRNFGILIPLSRFESISFGFSVPVNHYLILISNIKSSYIKQVNLSAI